VNPKDILSFLSDKINTPDVVGETLLREEFPTIVKCLVDVGRLKKCGKNRRKKIV